MEMTKKDMILFDRKTHSIPPPPRTGKLYPFFSNTLFMVAFLKV